MTWRNCLWIWRALNHVISAFIHPIIIQILDLDFLPSFWEAFASEVLFTLDQKDIRACGIVLDLLLALDANAKDASSTKSSLKRLCRELVEKRLADCAIEPDSKPDLLKDASLLDGLLSKFSHYIFADEVLIKVCSSFCSSLSRQNVL